MVARFSECAVVSNWLPHTPVQIFFRLVLVHKTIWCSLSSSSIQTGVLAGTFRVTLVGRKNLSQNDLMDCKIITLKEEGKVFLVESLNCCQCFEIRWIG